MKEEKTRPAVRPPSAPAALGGRRRPDVASVFGHHGWSPDLESDCWVTLRRFHTHLPSLTAQGRRAGARVKLFFPKTRVLRLTREAGDPQPGLDLSCIQIT
ncbi:hypothetical protein HPP92_006479 [Vanilla planifolia]|uniref:Uncharacterized protein n=1 Tax=Vanilla planifolia TaxID=51239 RepID=A0A835V582_VANPL|nr:hypothetical protein HPP92_006740 [Vanilla planifolia]KAG0489616.1 hypothetical protein HPP92_006479 [Vanilla planifolia]